MTLQECYVEHSYYYPKLEHEMKRIVMRKGLNGLGDKAIATFCSGVPGDLRLDSIEDYKNILDVFQCFVDGASWVLEHYPDISTDRAALLTAPEL